MMSLPRVPLLRGRAPRAACALRNSKLPHLCRPLPSRSPTYPTARMHRVAQTPLKPEYDTVALALGHAARAGGVRNTGGPLLPRAAQRTAQKVSQKNLVRPFTAGEVTPVTGHNVALRGPADRHQGKVASLFPLNSPQDLENSMPCLRRRLRLAFGMLTASAAASFAWRRLVLGRFFLVAAAAACLKGSDMFTGLFEPTPADCSPGDTFCMTTLSFTPTSRVVGVNATAKWINESGVTHDIVFDTPEAALAVGPEAGNFQAAHQTYHVRKFAAAGSYAFHCTIHGTATSGMRGTVVVQ